jgi:molecular chaperone DnaJ
MVFSRSCPACGGTGHQEQFLCTVCRGECLEARVDGIAVQVPAGVDDGARIRVADQGNAGRFGGPFGDLHVAVRVAPHELFRREGDDLSLVVPLAIHEAALGARIEVPSLEGPVRVRVPPGTQSGQRFRLRERGVRSVRDGRRGDLVVEVRLTLPKVLDERSKALLREFAQANPEDLRADLVNAK